MFGCVGWVMLRWIGAAVDGAVRVGGGAENVRDPRLPALKPPPTRASAWLASMPSASVTARTAMTLRSERRIISTSQGRRGARRPIFVCLYRVYAGAFEEAMAP